MEEIIKDNRAALDKGFDECCRIAESMIEEIHQITIPENVALVPGNGRHKASLKRKLLRQIRQARAMAMIG